MNHNDRKEGKESPIGLILYSGEDTEHIEYLMPENSDICVVQLLPDIELLKIKPQRAVKIAHDMMAERKNSLRLTAIS